MQQRAKDKLAAGLMLLAAIGMLCGGVFEVVVFETGAQATAKVIECRELPTRYHSVACTGTWATGRLVGGHGHVVTGTIDGATEVDVGHTLSVRLAGGRAYVPTVRIPLILLTFGVAFLASAVRLFRRRSVERVPAVLRGS